jgi:hypothetical protein
MERAGCLRSIKTVDHFLKTYMKKILILFSFLIAALTVGAQHGTFTDIRLVNGDSVISGTGNGTIFYNRVSNKFRFRQNGSWVSLGGSSSFTNPMTTAGDIITGGASGTPARLAMGSGLQQIRVNSGATALEYYSPSTNPMTTVGDMIIGGTVTSGVAAPARLAASTSGYVLTANGAGVAPTWQSAATSGWALTGSTTLTGAATIVGSSTNTIKFSVPSLGVTETDGAGLWLQNATAAAAGAQQLSPSIIWEGQGWKTTATAATQTVKYKAEVLPVQGTANPTLTWRLRSSVNASSYADNLTVTPTGTKFAITANTLGWYGSELVGATTYPALYDAAVTPSGTNYTVASLVSGAYGILNGGISQMRVAGNVNIEAMANQNNMIKRTLIGATAGTDTNSPGTLGIIQPVLTGANILPAFAITPGAHTGGVTATAYPDFLLSGSTKTVASGTVAVQAFSDFAASTWAGTSGTATATVLSTARFRIPVVGTNGAGDPSSIYLDGKIESDNTITGSGTTGNQTINKPSGTVRIAAAGTTVTVTNSMCTSTSFVYAMVRNADATAYVKNVVPSSGSFVINLGAAATAETEIQFRVEN